MAEYVIFDECGCEVTINFRRKLRPRAKHIAFTQVSGSDRFIVKGKSLMATTMTDVQSFTLSIVAEDAAGEPTTFGAAPTWAADSSGVVVVTPAADGMSAVISNASPPVLGTGVVTVTANGALPGGGPDPADVITGNYSVTVVAGEASQIVFSASTPAP